MKIIIGVFLTVFALAGYGYALFKENQRQVGLIADGTCVATGETRTVDRGYMICTIRGTNGICSVYMHVPNLVEEEKFQCPTESFWR